MVSRKTDYGVEVEREGVILEISPTSYNRYIAEYFVVLRQGEWPSNDELISIVSGTDPPARRCISGLVHRSPKSLVAEVVLFDD